MNRTCFRNLLIRYFHKMQITLLELRHRSSSTQRLRFPTIVLRGGRNQMLNGGNGIMFRFMAVIALMVVSMAASISMAEENETTAPFTHPGIPLTIAQLDAIKANLDREPWQTGYARLAAEGRSNPDYNMQGPHEHVSRNPHVNRNAWMSDMHAVGNLALRWYFERNEACARKARDILIAWADTQKSFTGMESNLDLGDFALHFVGGAELLRHTWSGWTADDTRKVESLFKNVYWGATGVGPDGRQTLGPANKGGLSLVAATSIAVFCDDRKRFDAVIEQFRSAAAAGLPDTVATGQMGETGRDQGHAYGHMLSLASIAEIAWTQGIDLFGENENRLLAIGEYYARHNMGDTPQFVPFGSTDALYWGPNDHTWGHIGPAFHLLASAYGLRKGLDTPWMDEKCRVPFPGSTAFLFAKEADNSVARPLPPIPFPKMAAMSKGFTGTDIGDAVPAGSAKYNSSDGVWTLTGGGRDIWRNTDDSAFVATLPIKGDGAVMAKIESIDAEFDTAKAGVILRDGLNVGARRAWVAITKGKRAEWSMTGWNEIRGGENWARGERGLPTTPYWVKIQRRGDIVELFAAVDGTSWSPIAAARFYDLAPTVHIGLVACSQKNGSPMTAKFSHVKATGGDGRVFASVPESPYAVVANAGRHGATIRWLPSVGAARYIIKRASTAEGPFKKVGEAEGTKTVYLDKPTASAPQQTIYWYTVSAANDTGESANAKPDRTTVPWYVVEVEMVGPVTASSGGGSEGPEKAFDRSTATKWFTGDGAQAWIQIDLGKGKAVAPIAYDICTANDEPGRDPRDWTLEGSGDGKTWSVLDRREGNVFGNERHQRHRFPIAKTKSFRFFRLSITANHGGRGVQLSDIDLLVPSK